MANTPITLVNDGGIYIPSVPQVSVVAGDSVTFTTSDGSALLLFFSPDAASVLSPGPGKSFAIATGGSATFNFTSSAPAAYSVFFGAGAASAPTSFPTAVSQSLTLELGGVAEPPPFSGPHDTTRSGS